MLVPGSGHAGGFGHSTTEETEAHHPLVPPGSPTSGSKVTSSPGDASP